MLTFSKTGFGTGCFLGGIFHPAVTLGLNDFLSDDDSAANRAMAAFGKTGFGAGCCNGGINYGFVTVRLNHFLLNKNHAAG